MASPVCALFFHSLKNSQPVVLQRNDSALRYLCIDNTSVYKNGRCDATFGPAHSITGVNAYTLKSRNIGKYNIVTVLIYI